MLIVTTDFITGHEIETLSIVRGSCVKTVHLGKDFVNGFRAMVGGELNSYTEMMDGARETATDRMIREAKGLNADAIIGVRYTTSNVAANAAEVMAFGTAVRFRK